MRLLLLALALLPLPAVAQSPAQAQEDSTEAVTRLSRHMTEMRDLMNSRDRSVRDAAIETALHDPSPTVRGMAVTNALRRYDRLPLHFALPDGSSIQPEDLPALTLERVKWNEDGRTFTAVSSISCSPFASVNAAGQVIGDRLRLQVEPVCLSPHVPGTIARAAANVSDKPVAVRGCEAEMAPNATRDQLAGTLRCPGVPTPLPIVLPLG